MRTTSSAKDSILAITLLLLCFFLYSRNLNFIYAALFLIILSLLYHPVAVVVDKGWKKLSLILGMISSSIILSVLFYVIVFPLGMMLKLLNKRPLLLDIGNKKSTFILRQKLFSDTDFQNPF